MISHLEKKDKVLTTVRKKKKMTHKGSRIFVFPSRSPTIKVWREKLTTKKTDSLEFLKNIYSYSRQTLSYLNFIQLYPSKHEFHTIKPFFLLPLETHLKQNLDTAKGT